jgi:hypothetical protein
MTLGELGLTDGEEVMVTDPTLPFPLVAKMAFTE